jgi:hypothetical protein
MKYLIKLPDREYYIGNEGWATASLAKQFDTEEEAHAHKTANDIENWEIVEYTPNSCVNTAPAALIYFKTYAKENGCLASILNSGSDLAIWNWIREYQIITIWECEDNHNHISNGYDADATSPTPNCPSQEKAWKKGKWNSIEGHITCYHKVKRGKVQWTNKIPQS